MKKKFATMILIGSLICMNNCTVIQAYEQQEVNGDISIVSSDKILNYDHYELQTDDDGKPAIVIYFEFTNNTDEAKSASSSYWFDVFQNGIERDSTTIPNNDSFSDGLHYHVTDIKNGATVNTCFACELDDTTTEVELEVKSKDTSEVQKLKIDISKYDNEIFPIKTETNDNESASLKTENEELKEKLSTLERENEKLTDQNKNLKDENKELKDENEKLIKENEELKAAQTTPAPEETPAPEPTEAPQIPVTEYKDATTIRITQQALNEAGYNCGNPDGVAGSKTSQAITSYQTAKGITVNGLVTDELLQSLGIVEKVQEAVKAEGAKNEYSADYSYDQLARTPDTYIGNKVKIKGKVLQADSSGDTCYARVAMNSSYDTVVFVTYPKDLLGYRLLEDDIVTVYGVSLGVYSYEAVSGATITIPWLNADIIEM